MSANKCGCGCGGETGLGKRFILGHFSKLPESRARLCAWKPTDEARAKMSLAKTGKKWTLLKRQSNEQYFQSAAGAQFVKRLNAGRDKTRKKENRYATFNTLFHIYRYKASKRQLSFDLTKEQFQMLTQQNCYYCGQPPSNQISQPRTNGAYEYNGLDRINNSLGYTINNVVPCCFVCNQAKHTMSQREFYIWLNRLIEYQQTHKRI